MTLFRLTALLAAFALLSACQTTLAGGEDYERHKSNREAYLYQGR